MKRHAVCDMALLVERMLRVNRGNTEFHGLEGLTKKKREKRKKRKMMKDVILLKRLNSVILE